MNYCNMICDFGNDASICDFDRDLEFSRGEREKMDIDILRKYFDGCASVIKTDKATDRKGIDYIVTLKNSAQILVDGKTRRCGVEKKTGIWRGPTAESIEQNTVEVALEIWSVCETKKLGWTLSDKTNVDYILYTFGSFQKCYFVPFQLLRKAFFKKGRDWYNTWRHSTQKSVDKKKRIEWHSKAMFVPVNVVLDAVKREMMIV